MSRFEDKAIRQLPSSAQKGLDFLEVAELKKLTADFDRERPDMRSFSDVYETKEIMADEQLVRTKQSTMEGQTTPEDIEQRLYAGILEMVIVEFGSSWLPGYISKTSLFDDTMRATDLVLEAQGEDDKLVRIGIDATMGDKSAVKKVSYIRAQLNRGELSELKYFKSEIDDTKGKITLPHVILGTTNLGVISQLARLYKNYQKASDSKSKKMYRDLIINHAVGYELREQIKYQLKISLNHLAQGRREAVRSSTVEAIDKYSTYIRDAVTIFDDFENTLAERTEKEKTPERSSTGTGANAITRVIEKEFATV